MLQPWFVVVALTTAVNQPPAPKSDDDRAREAKVACAAGDVQTGVQLLAELYASSNEINWVYNQARCYQQNGKAEQAIERFREFLRRATELSPAERAETEVFISDLQKSLASKTPSPVVTPDPVGTAPPTPPTTEKQPDASVAAQAPASPGPRERKLYLASAGAAGLGVVALVTGLVFHAKQGQVSDDYSKLAGQREQVGGTINPGEWEKAQSRGQRYRNLEITSYVVAGLSLAGGGACFYLARRERDRGPRTESMTRLWIAPVISSQATGAQVAVAF